MSQHGPNPFESFKPKDGEGAVQVRAGPKGDTVILDFGAPVQQIGLDAQQAADLASVLIRWSQYLGALTGQPVALDLSAK